ncbi:hypothetical protein [Acidisoma silvae]|uniref:Uncharacterized protein n=1 Tax=Acidisoma silvae TaxID=2802396 RepID=A0A963YRY5_9PROT|nr:hypothetical protein [Acidisoma silvae]MCB8875998.1 hypothetical protein [Acidisoma silvae]
MTDERAVVVEPNDRLMIWPVFILFVAILFLIFAVRFFGVLLSITIIFATLIALAWFLTAAISYFRRRSWRRGVSLAMAFAMFWPGAFGCLRASDYIVFVAAFPYFATQIYRSGCNTQSNFYFGEGEHYGSELIYDPSDQLAKQIGNVDERADNMEIITTKHLIGHWYVQTQNWATN